MLSTIREYALEQLETSGEAARRALGDAASAECWTAGRARPLE
jgi:hypothetical protein